MNELEQLFQNLISINPPPWHVRIPLATAIVEPIVLAAVERWQTAFSLSGSLQLAPHGAMFTLYQGGLIAAEIGTEQVAGELTIDSVVQHTRIWGMEGDATRRPLAASTFIRVVDHVREHLLTAGLLSPANAVLVVENLRATTGLKSKIADQHPIEQWNIDGQTQPVRIGSRIVADLQLKDAIIQQLSAEPKGERATGKPSPKEVIERFYRAKGQNPKITLKQICEEMHVNYDSIRVAKVAYDKRKKRQRKN